jgi:hypothetical protein
VADGAPKVYLTEFLQRRAAKAVTPPQPKPAAPLHKRLWFSLTGRQL